MVDSEKTLLRVVDTMMVFDLDGVVTDPITPDNKVNSEVIAAVIDDLRHHIPVAFNTGRSVQWVEERILPFLGSLDAATLSLLVLVGEKGGVVTEFDNNQLKTVVDKTLSLPEEFTRNILSMLQIDRGGWSFNDCMFWDADKLTMGSIEKRAGVPVSEFHERREVLTGELEKLMQKYQLADFKLDPTVISTDIEHRTAGKHKGAEQILAWLKRKRIDPKAYVTFGDSPSDSEMAAAFSVTGTPTTFVYVGERKFQAPESAKYESIIMNGKYSADTLEHLVHMKR